MLDSSKLLHKQQMAHLAIPAHYQYFLVSLACLPACESDHNFG